MCLLLQPAVETVKPANQVQLSEKELAEEHGRVLNAARPGPSRVIFRYNLEDRCYKPEPQLDQVLLHFAGEGNLLHREGGEGQALLKAYAAEDERLVTASSQVRPVSPGTMPAKDCIHSSICLIASVSHVLASQHAKTFMFCMLYVRFFTLTGNAQACIHQVAGKVLAAQECKLAAIEDCPSLQANAGTDASNNGKRLRNQFNFSERGIQTVFYLPRERGTNTEDPESAEAAGTCSRWEIYDAYSADQKQQRQQVNSL